jgi:hypothetical protein
MAKERRKGAVKDEIVTVSSVEAETFFESLGFFLSIFYGTRFFFVNG